MPFRQYNLLGAYSPGVSELQFHPMHRFSRTGGWPALWSCETRQRASPTYQIRTYFVENSPYSFMENSLCSGEPNLERRHLINIRPICQNTMRDDKMGIRLNSTTAGPSCPNLITLKNVTERINE